MLYHVHEWQHWGLKTYFGMMASAMDFQAHMFSALKYSPMVPKAYSDMAKLLSASAEVTDRIVRDYDRPAFNINFTRINGRNVGVNEAVIDKRDFCSLINFRRDTRRVDPKVLIVVPTSGHYPTLLRDMIETLLPYHDVYLTNWENARDVPKSAGDFGLDDYIGYTQDFIRQLGPNVHVIGFSQSTVPVLAAVSLMAARDNDVQPLSMTLMGGPIDTRAAHSEVSKFAMAKNLSWFRDNLITPVPSNFKGAGRNVYPGFLQLMGFMSLNPNHHVKSHLDLFNLLTRGSNQEAAKIKEFYDEYLAVSDLPARFYLDTIDQVFQRHTLPRGQMVWNGEKVDPSRITRTPLFTVEGENDDITRPGQTLPAHGLCSGLRQDQHYHFTQRGIGHYGIINGQPCADAIIPRIAGHIRQAALQRGIAYDPLPKTAKQPVIPHAIDPGPFRRYLTLINNPETGVRRDGPANRFAA